MTTKSCGTCEFWDRENSRTVKVCGGAVTENYAICLSRDTESDSFWDRMKEWCPTTSSEGQDCPVYKKIKEE